MTITGCLVDRGVRILAAAMLLMALMLSPTRLVKGSNVVSSPLKISRQHAIHKLVQNSHSLVAKRLTLRENSATETDPELEADIEDETVVTSPATSECFDALPSPCPKLYSRHLSIGSAITICPLRC